MSLTSKIKEFTTRLLLVIIGCIVGFLIGEGLLRLFLPGYVATAGIERNFFCQFASRLGWAPLPNVSGIHRRDGFAVFVEQNQFGLRGPTSMQKSSAQPRILILGDSYVWGYGVNQDKVFTEQSVQSSGIELINFGVSGYGTDQEYLLYQQEGTSFETDEVTLVVTPYNDIENNLSSRQYDKNKPFFTLKNNTLELHTDHLNENTLQSFLNNVWAESRVINVLFMALRAYQNWEILKKAKGGTAIPTTSPLSPSVVSPRDQEGIALTTKIIAELRDVVLTTGATFSVTFVPYKPHILNKVSYNHPLVPILTKELEAAGITYYEPYFIFLKEAATKSLFNTIDNHFSPEGHTIFRRSFIEKEIREQTKNLYHTHQTSTFSH